VPCPKYGVRQRKPVFEKRVRFCLQAKEIRRHLQSSVFLKHWTTCVTIMQDTDWSAGGNTHTHTHTHTHIHKLEILKYNSYKKFAALWDITQSIVVNSLPTFRDNLSVPYSRVNIQEERRFIYFSEETRNHANS